METRFGRCRPNIVQLQLGGAEQLDGAFVPDLALAKHVQLLPPFQTCRFYPGDHTQTEKKQVQRKLRDSFYTTKKKHSQRRVQWQAGMQHTSQEMWNWDSKQSRWMDNWFTSRKTVVGLGFSSTTGWCPLSSRWLSEINTLRTSPTSHDEVHVASTRLEKETPLPVTFYGTRSRLQSQSPLGDLAVFFRGYSLHDICGNTWWTTSSFWLATELMMWHHPNPHETLLSTALDCSVPTASTSWQSPTDEHNLAGWFPDTSIWLTRRSWCRDCCLTVGGFSLVVGCWCHFRLGRWHSPSFGLPCPMSIGWVPLFASCLHDVHSSWRARGGGCDRSGMSLIKRFFLRCLSRSLWTLNIWSTRVNFHSAPLPCMMTSVGLLLFLKNTSHSRSVFSLVGSRIVELVVGHPQPSLSGTGVPWVSLPGDTGVPQSPGWLCGKAPTPLGVVVGVVGVVTWCGLCVRVPRLCATENTYTLARLEARFKLSVVTHLSHLHQISTGCGCFLQWNSLPTNLDWYVLYLVILFEMASHFSCLLGAVSQSILFT